MSVDCAQYESEGVVKKQVVKESDIISFSRKSYCRLETSNLEAVPPAPEDAGSHHSYLGDDGFLLEAKCILQIRQFCSSQP